MTATLTSISAFHSIGADRKAQEDLLLALYGTKGPLTDREACYLLNWEAPSVVSARRSGLSERGLVAKLNEKKNPISGKTNGVYGIIKETLF